MSSGEPLKLRILIIHNRYRLPGGEDVVADAQVKLLRKHGHEVKYFEKDNREIDGYGLFRKAALFFKTSDNRASADEVARIALEFKPHVAHVHNTLPLLSPSIYAPLKSAGVKVIQYLHNYRLVCAAGTLHRDGASCSLCVDDGLKHAVQHKCWTGSTAATLAVTRMLERHRRLRTWENQVDLFVALNSFLRDVVVKKKIVPAANIVVQPNFIGVPLPAAETLANAGNGFLFAGRFVAEKGIATLLKSHALAPEIELTVLGDGPLKDTFGPHAPTLTFAGQRPRAELLQRLAAARALVFPSDWHEGCPAIVIEAMALGRPVIASRVAGATELIDDGVNGLLFDTGDPAALAQCMRRLQNNPDEARRLGAAGRARYLNEYSIEAGYRRTIENYRRLEIPVD